MRLWVYQAQLKLFRLIPVDSSEKPQEVFFSDDEVRQIYAIFRRSPAFFPEEPRFSDALQQKAWPLEIWESKSKRMILIP